MTHMRTMFLLAMVGGLVAPLFAADGRQADQDTARQDLYQACKDAGVDAPQWLVEELFPGSTGEVGDGLGAFSDDDNDGRSPARAKDIEELPYSDHERTTSASGASNAVPSSAYTTPSLCAQLGNFYTGTARDRSYRISLDAPTSLDIDLCNAGFDTVLGVFEASGSSLGACVARDDDGCGANRHSRILSCPLPAGDYFIIVDGSGSQTGVYTLEVDRAVCIDPGYPAGYDLAIEDEGSGMDSNGGCSDDDDAFEPITDGTLLGGTTWAWDDERDEDWFELVLEESGSIHATLATGCVPMELKVLDAACPAGSEYAAVEVEANSTDAAHTACLPAGLYRVLVQPMDDDGFDDSDLHHYGLGIEVESCALPCEAPLELVAGDVVNANAPTQNNFTAGMDSCTGGQSNGYDHEYQITIAEECDALFTMDVLGELNAVLSLRTDCADAGSCIAGADSLGAGGTETLGVHLMPGVYFLIADFNEPGGAAYSLTVSTVNSQQVGVDVETTAFTLQTAAPNPFNPATTLAYDLNETGPVTLTVYDLQGRLVETLVDGMREAGFHRVTFDGNRLASGVYIYTLQAGGQLESRKMILAK